MVIHISLRILLSNNQLHIVAKKLIEAPFLEAAQWHFPHTEAWKSMSNLPSFFLAYRFAVGNAKTNAKYIHTTGQLVFEGNILLQFPYLFYWFLRSKWAHWYSLSVFAINRLFGIFSMKRCLRWAKNIKTISIGLLECKSLTVIALPVYPSKRYKTYRKWKSFEVPATATKI